MLGSGLGSGSDLGLGLRLGWQAGTGGPLQGVLVVGGEVAAELREEVAQEGGVGHHGDALLRPRVEPLQEGDG